MISRCTSAGAAIWAPGTPLQLAAERVETLASTSGSVAQRLGKQGQTLEFHSSRLPDGGAGHQLCRCERAGRRRRPRSSAPTRASRGAWRSARRRCCGSIPNSRAPARRPTPPTATRPAFSPPPATTCCSRSTPPGSIPRPCSSGPPAAESGALAHSIEASLNAVEEIMSALLDMSRIDSGALKPQPAPFAVQRPDPQDRGRVRARWRARNRST